MILELHALNCVSDLLRVPFANSFLLNFEGKKNIICGWHDRRNGTRFISAVRD